MPEEPAVTEPAPQPEPAPEATFSQADVDRIVQQRIAREKSKALGDFADELGVPADELAAKVKGWQEAEKAAMSEAERAKAEAETAKARAEAERAQLAADRKRVDVQRHLLGAGVNGDQLDRVTTLVLAEVPADADDDAIAAAVDTLHTELPALFTSTPAAPKPPGSTPARRVQHKPPETKSLLEQGKERAAAVRQGAFDNPKVGGGIATEPAQVGIGSL